jgi:hypothetical protein
MANVQEKVDPMPPAIPQPSFREWLVPPALLSAVIILALGFMVVKHW